MSNRESEDPPVVSRWCVRSLGAEAAATAGLGKSSGRSGDVSWLGQYRGHPPARLMIEFVTVSISQASEGAQFLPEPPLAQQHVSSCSFTPM